MIKDFPTVDFERKKVTVEVDGNRKQKIIFVAKERLPFPTFEISSLEQNLACTIESLEYKIYGKNQIQQKLKSKLAAVQKQQTELDQEEEKNKKFLDIYQRSSSNDSLPIPNDFSNEDSSERIGIATARHLPKLNEDAELATQFKFKIGDQSYLAELTAIFDGHGDQRGATASNFAKKNIVELLQKRLEQSQSTEITDEVIANALTLALVDLSRSYKEEKGGSTANIVLKIGNDLWIANDGDSRALLVENETAKTVQLSKDQKVAEEKYQKGIKKRGGKIKEQGEGCGERIAPVYSGLGLNVPRGIGDHKYSGAVSARPEITKYTLDPNHSYHLVQACDGLFDVVPSSSLLGSIALELYRQSKEPKDLASIFVKLAAAADSDDNISVLVKLIPSNGQLL